LEFDFSLRAWSANGSRKSSGHQCQSEHWPLHGYLRSKNHQGSAVANNQKLKKLQYFLTMGKNVLSTSSLHPLWFFVQKRNIKDCKKNIGQQNCVDGEGKELMFFKKRKEIKVVTTKYTYTQYTIRPICTYALKNNWHGLKHTKRNKSR